MVKTECKNVMLLEDMNIFRLMTHGQQVEGDNLKEQLRKRRRLVLGTMIIHSRNRVVEIVRRISKSFRRHPLHTLVSNPPRTGTTNRVENQAFNLRKVFQAPRLTPHALSVERIIRRSVL